MDIKDLDTLIEQGETSNVEFKKSTATLHAAFETLSAFLNGNGGTVIIGITDKGKLVGQEVSDSTRKDIARKMALLEPTVNIDIAYITITQKKQVIVLTVQAGMHKPYQFDGRAYMRTESTTVRMGQHI